MSMVMTVFVVMVMRMLVRMIARDALQLDLDTLQRRDGRGKKLGRNLANIVAMLVRQEIVSTRDLDRERGLATRTALPIPKSDRPSALDPAHVFTIRVSS